MGLRGRSRGTGMIDGERRWEIVCEINVVVIVKRLSRCRIKVWSEGGERWKDERRELEGVVVQVET